MLKKATFLPTSSRTHPHIGSKKTFLQTGGSDHRAQRLDRLAKAQGCDIGRIGRLQADLYEWCSSNADGGDGRLPYDDSRALTDLAAVDDLGDAEKLLRNALEAGFVVRRWGHLYMPAFKRAFPIAHVHARAKVARAERDRDELQHRHRGYQRTYAARRKADLIDWQQTNRLPSDAPRQPLRLVAPPKPTRAPPQIDLSNISARSQQCPSKAIGGRAELPAAPSSSQIDLSKISAPPADAFYGGLRARISKSQRLKSIGSPPALPVHECEPPSSTASLNEDQEGSEHVRLNQGETERSPQTAERSSQAVKSHCTEDKGTPDAGSEAETPQQPATAPVMPSAPQFGQSMPPADFTRHVRALFACRAASADIMAVFKERMGTDWKIVEQLLGPTPASELNKMDDRLREQSLAMLISRQLRDYRRQEAGRPAPKPGGEQLLASLGVQRPTADGPPPASPAPPPRDSLPAIVERVCGRRAGEVYVGPDLVHRVKQLPVSPEQVELAFKEAAQRPPSKFSSIGWAALTRLERVAGLKPAFEGGD